mmetsp:Transcript_830/g.1136  ORF Transcript_830/g.1136 Transcript_830/m.1136 type:complete len:208 (-) Transcript_830:1797-2420(-)
MNIQAINLMENISIKNISCVLCVSNLDLRVDEEILYELFLQIGSIESIHLPRDLVDDHHYGYGFIEYKEERNAENAIKILGSIRLYDKLINLNMIRNTEKYIDVGANIYIGNLSQDISEKILFDTFSNFGSIIKTPKIIKTYTKKGTKFYALISYESFESSDSAIYAMNGQFFGGSIIYVCYAISHDTKKRHGTNIERLLSENKKFF